MPLRLKPKPKHKPPSPIRLNEEAAAALEMYRKSLNADASRVYMDKARAFLSWLGDRPLNRQSIEAYVIHLREAQGKSQTTIRHTWGVIHALCVRNSIKWPFIRGQAPEVDQSMVSKPALRSEVVQRLVEAARSMDPMYAAFLALSTVYGVRRVEIVAMAAQAGASPLRRGNDACYVHVSTGKHGQRRWHLCPPEVYAYLERWGFSESRTESEVSIAFNAISQKAGLSLPKGASYHSIRRSLVHALLMTNLPEATVHHFLRWADQGRMTLHYSHVQMVGLEGIEDEGMPSLDKDVDAAVFGVHPFLAFWK